MRARFKAPEIYVSHFKTLGELIVLLNSRTRLAKRVSAFIDKLRRIPGRNCQPFTHSNVPSITEALHKAHAELHKYRWSVVLELECVPDTGRRWSIRPNLDNEYQTWLWAVLDYDRAGAIDRVLACPQCGKTFLRKRRSHGKYCTRLCAQQAQRSQPGHKERAKRRNRVYMHKRRLDDSLGSATSGKWERLAAAGYVFHDSTKCQTCGATIEWWRTPPRRKRRGRPPRRVKIPVQKISGNRIRTHWPH
jgi:hypothetical protein